MLLFDQAIKLSAQIWEECEKSKYPRIFCFQLLLKGNYRGLNHGVSYGDVIFCICEGQGWVIMKKQCIRVTSTLHHKVLRVGYERSEKGR